MTFVVSTRVNGRGPYKTTLVWPIVGRGHSIRQGTLWSEPHREVCVLVASNCVKMF